ncbi:FAD-dependent oxidoreductase [Deltaproteobacteria bacterium]|nr:FAD-dependent oxidoreductase [Deltaproteobacteria bacterium]
MPEFSRRTFLKFLGGSTAILGMGISRNAWAQRGGAKAMTVSGKILETDVAIIGGGAAGLAAAISAAERGANVIVFEKAGRTGGAGNMASGIFAAESKMQIVKQLPLTREEAFKIHMDWTHWRVDAKLVKAYIDKSASTIDWLEKMGVEFTGFSEFGARSPQRHDTAHVVKGSAVMASALANKAKKLGVQILLNAPIKKIIEKGGRIAGVISENETGESIQVNSGAVIVATGGFSDNPDWVKKYTGFESGKNLFPMSISGLTGDGIRISWEVGAAATEMVMPIMQNVSCMGYEAIETSFLQPTLVVNLSGERFINEDIIARNSTLTANALAQQKKKLAFSIIDEDIKNYYGEIGWDIPVTRLFGEPVTKASDFNSELEQAISQKSEDIIRAYSLEELAMKTGINLGSLKNTVDEYNISCQTGRDKLFNRNPKYLRPIIKPPFYCGKFLLRATNSLGGIKINHKTQVLNEDQEIIQGLYAAGTDANAINGDTYIPFAGSMFGFAVNSGRIAGENAAKYVS